MMKFPVEIIVNTEEETSKLANELKNVFKSGDVICLNGNLGSGKTFFVKEFAKFFEINNVSSPSFALVNEYYGKIKIIHFDFYRIKKIDELYDIGIKEYLIDDAIIFIEWANLFDEILPKKYYEIEIKFIDNQKRKFIIKKHE